jgi:PASTA domain
MAARFAAIVPRMAVIGLVWLLATGTLTYAAGTKLSAPKKVPAPVATPRPILTVPDIRGQAFVFAKGILEDGGFGWRVSGSIQGYATNVVATQQPAPGTRVQDTGAPTLTLSLRHGMYPQDGTPENSSPYAGTSIVLPKRATAPLQRTVARKSAAARPKVAKKVAAKPAVKRAKRAVAKPKPKRTPVKHKVTTKRSRPPAFVVPGARKEPLSEIPLTTRAQRLGAWLTPSRRPTAANQHYWLFQHAWIVTGARFGWWHGAAALRLLIKVDQRIESQWGIGRRSEAVVRSALTEVEAKAK